MVDLLITLYLSIYIPGVYPHEKGNNQDKAFRVQEELTLTTCSALCLFLGEKTEEGASRPLLCPFVLLLTIGKEYSGSTFAALP